MKQNMKKNKSRIIALLVAVFALVPVCLLCVGAYPAEVFIPPTSSESLGGSSLPVDYKYFETVNLEGQPVGDEFEYSFGNLQYSMADASQPWRYLAVQFTIESETQPFGHYSIGLCRGAFDVLYLRIGYDYTINGERFAAFPVYAELPAEASQYLFGFRVSRQTDGSSVFYAEALVFDDTGRIVEAGYMSVPIPTEATRGAVELKTEYARIINVDVINDTAVQPHMPTDLLTLADAYDAGDEYGYGVGFDDGFAEGRQDGYHDAAYDAVNNFDNMGKLIWTVVDMPFVLVTQILNFDIFGVNMGDIVLGLVTIGLCVFILHKVGVF